MIIPQPVELTRGEGAFLLDAAAAIDAAPELARVARRLQGELRAGTGLPLREAAGGAIRLELDPALPDEGYRLRVGAEGIRILAADAAGASHASQTLRQLLPPASFRRAPVGEPVPIEVPAVEIVDAPRFRWRGMMLDVVRHFLPTREVLRMLDLLALHRLNVLHLHLTDDQGWRMEIRKYPRLTEVGGWRHESQVGAGEEAGFDGRPHGGFYTQDDLREIVAYAAERGITVVPEIETPGHVQAAIAAYPELGVGEVPASDPQVWPRWGINPTVLNLEESTLDFFRDVFDEVLEIFPSEYIGVGGDECPREQWREDPRTQERMRELGIEEEAGLQAWFIRQLDDHLSARGRRLYGWDEILEGELAPGATVASWRGMQGALTAARRGHDVVACPDHLVYLDYRQSEGEDEPIPVSIPLTLDDVYGFEPVPLELSEEEAAHVIGGQANVWSEHMDSPRTVDFFVFPRLLAVAEALWSPVARRDLADFRARLPRHLEILDALGVEYRHEDGPRPWQRRPGIPGRPSTREAREAAIAALVADIAD
ncbi:beta-N-acetylhexosaminidase [Homoserinibacter sp. YIM 151385]|uniref:beta-N-acetylhexosaminidase n=1 Tax=Homoserinibacter sp. YIM 151385 TaxID=2985506 RepID=UPI0022F1350B|nr:beta-N-acetylhexosaminidase [Homoserinibacter sp. YIM 151385]WBU36776.1 beta-N-acetylhexosaminidase [Homoserinibacter sp. YIM 151385]